MNDKLAQADTSSMRTYRNLEPSGTVVSATVPSSLRLGWQRTWRPSVEPREFRLYLTFDTITGFISFESGHFDSHLAYTVDLAHVDSFSLKKLFESHSAIKVSGSIQMLLVSTKDYIPVVCMLAGRYAHDALETSSDFGMAKYVIRCSRLFDEPKVELG